jgi:hypothetical protein
MVLQIIEEEKKNLGQRWCLKTLLQHLSRANYDQNITVHIANIDVHDICILLINDNDPWGLLFIT